MNMDTVDEHAVGAFAERMMADCAGGLTALLAALGDRHGLFRVLAEGGPATPAELASRAGIAERYAREWLCGVTAAGYLSHEPESGRFTLPAAHIPVLALDDTPASLGGPLQWLLGVLPALDAVSLFYCLSASLAAGGPGLGSLGLPARRLAEVAAEAGFAGPRKVLDSPPAHTLYELLP